MADTWTPISGYTPQDYTDTMVFEMSSETKKVETIMGQALVAGEENSQYIKFVLPRYWDGIDISGKTFSVEYALSGQYYGTSEAVNAEMTTDKVRFGWVVPEEACCISGKLLFVLRIESADYILKSQIVEVSVYKSINVEDVVPEPTREAWYRDFAARVEVAIDEAEAALAQAQQAVVSAETAAQNAQTAEDNAEAAAASAQTRYGSPLVATTAEEMTDENRVYVYVGSESGYTNGNWYYYDGSAWTSGGVYNSTAVNTDTTLTQSGTAADAKATGDEINSIVNSAYVTDSASGSVAHFTDGANDVPMKSVKVNIAPVQSGSGDPSPSNVRPISGYDSVKVYVSPTADSEDAMMYNVSLASAGTVYGGTFDVISGALTVDRAIKTFNGSESWYLSNGGMRCQTPMPSDAKPNSANTNLVGAISNEFVEIIPDRTWDGASGAGFCVDTERQLNVCQTGQKTMTVDSWKSWLASHNMQIVYPLATPITYSLTPTEVKSLLGVNNIWSDAGDVEIEYKADTKLYIDKSGLKREIINDAVLNENSNARHVKGNTINPLTILHFSDLHGDKNALERIMSDREEFDSHVDEVICTGDMVLNTAGQIASWWNPKVLTCVGNHDSASYSTADGYNWTALNMANRDAYYIAPFESNWDITHTSGTSYYYKDYTQKVRLIVMDAMLYNDNGTEATAQTAWLENLLSDAITNNLHVLIAIHSPHGGATAEDCSFSKYGQGTMPTYTDCNTPQTVIDIVAAAITNGLHFIGYIVGHTHQDNIWNAEGDSKQLMYCVTCAAVDQTAHWINSDQNRSISQDAYNLVTIDTANTLVKIVRGGGADIDDHMRTRKAICFDYSTGQKVGEV